MSPTKNKILSTCILASVIAAPATAFAGADSGFYIGAGAGEATVSVGPFDESDAAYKVFGGYNVGFIPLVDFAVEASYVDFGNPASGLQNVKVTGVNAFGLAGLSFGPFGVFVKGGVIDWDADFNDGTTKSGDSGTDAAYGVGARFALGSIAVRAEYEVYDLEADLEMLSVSAVITF